MTAHDAAMCKCGTVWLTSYSTVFHAEGSEHSRNWCRRITNPGVRAPVSAPDPIPPGG